MNTLRSTAYWVVVLTVLVSFIVAAAQTPAKNKQAGGESPQNAAVSRSYSRDLVQKGRALFREDCSFCHGRDATGGESGPDLTRSKLVKADVDGDKISVVVRNGRPEKGMPPFDRSEEQVASLVAFIHTQQNRALAGGGRTGGRKGVDPSDLQTGNVVAGRQYFNGAGGCASCHSPTGDLRASHRATEALNWKSRCFIPGTQNRKLR